MHTILSTNCFEKVTRITTDQENNHIYNIVCELPSFTDSRDKFSYQFVALFKTVVEKSFIFCMRKVVEMFHFYTARCQGSFLIEIWFKKCLTLV